MVSAAVCCEAEVLLLLIHCLLLLPLFGARGVLGLCFVMRYFVSFLSRLKRVGVVDVVFFQSYWCCYYSRLPHSAMCRSTVCAYGIC